eukprot:4906677-Pyramimonas_sp.AAC.1
MHRAKGCDVLRRAELRCAMPRACSLPSLIESSFASESRRDSLRNAPMDVPPHARHPPGETGHVKTSESLETSSTHHH